MKKKVIILLSVLLLTFSAGTYAGTIIKSYKTPRGNTATIEKEEIHKNRIGMVVNGKTVNSPTIYFGGTTYVPLRAVSENLGASVQYDSSKMVANITSNKSSTPPAPPSSVGKTRATAAKINQTVSINHKDFVDGQQKFDLTLTEVIKGQAAWQIIQEENQFNDAPSAGKQYVLAKFKVKVHHLDNEPMSLDNYMFNAVSNKGVKYNDFISLVIPSPTLDTTYYTGSQFEGWTYFEVAENDQAKVVFLEGWDGESWFDLGN